MAAPKLRFKEFDGDWSLSSLSEISSIITGNTPSTSNREYYDGEFLFVSPADIQENRYIEKTKTTLTANGFSKCRHIPENSVLFVCIGSTIGKVAQNKVICATNQQINAVIPQKGYSSDFLYLQLERLAPNIKLNAGVQAVPLINKTEFGKTLLNTPVYIEQTKIASFLSAVDEKISQLTQKHELLSQYKQGMMQKLFSQEIRFKADDGSEFGEWKIDKIKNVFTNKSKSFNPHLNENLPCIELEHLSQNTGQILGTVNSKDQQSTKNIFEENSVLFGKLRPYLRKFAQPNFKGVCSSEIWVLTGLKISNGYLFQYIQSEQFSELTNIQSGSKMPRADWGVISDADIEYPCLEEQTKIANFLSAIDQKIEVVAQQIEQAKTWKKGLLQQMFV